MRPTRNDLTHAVLDGVAFAFRDCLDALHAAGTEVEARDRGRRRLALALWLKIIATVLGIPVDVPADGDFGGAFGAARLGLIAATGADPSQVCTPPPIRRDHRARREGARPPMTTPIARYAQLYPAIKELNRQ